MLKQIDNAFYILYLQLCTPATVKTEGGKMIGGKKGTKHSHKEMWVKGCLQVLERP